MVTQREDDNNRRIQRLEQLIAILVAFDSDYDAFDRDFMLRRLADGYDGKEFSYLLRDILRDRGPRGRREALVDENRALVENFSRRVEALERQNQPDRNHTLRIGALESKVKRISRQFGEFKNEMTEHLVATSLGIDPRRIRTHKYVPVRVYLSEDDEQAINNLENALSDFLRLHGFETAREFPSESGSWFKKIFARTKEVLTSDEAEEMLKAAKKSFEIAAVEKKRAEVNKENSEAIAALLGAVESIPNAAMSISSLLVIKLTDEAGMPSVFTRTLSETELEYLENNQDILKSPGTILDNLAKIECGTSGTSIQIGTGKI